MTIPPEVSDPAKSIASPNLRQLYCSSRTFCNSRYVDPGSAGVAFQTSLYACLATGIHKGRPGGETYYAMSTPEPDHWYHRLA